jgi:alcohol dehydrogenase class IV
MRSDYFDFILPTSVVFGLGKIEVLPAELSRSGFGRAVIVTDRGIEEAGILDEPIVSLKQRGIGVEVFAEVQTNPHVESVKECLQFLRDHGPDCIIAIGGGSSLDTAKAAGACYANDLDDVVQVQREKELKRSPPVIAVPTTAGTGSEVNYWAVIASGDEKLSIGDPAMAPYMAIVDPELTLTLPPKLTFWTGIDALTHAIEAYLSLSSNRLSDMLCLEAISLILESLEQAVEESSNLRARGDMALASLLAGAAMQHVGLGLVHAMSHQVSGIYNTPHGLANAILLPHVLEFNAPECQDEMKNLDDLVQNRNSFIEWLEEIYKKYDLSGEAIEIKAGDIPTMAERARDNVNARTNPREARVSDIIGIYKKSFKVAG